MANVDAPFGLRPVGELGSEVQNSGTTQYRIASGYGTAIYKGDLVILVNATGTLNVAGNGDTDLVGVFNGCFYNDPTTQKPTWKNYYPGSISPSVGNIDAFVYDDPNKLFEIQAEGSLTYAATVGKNVDIVYTAGATINGQSKVEIKDEAPIAATRQLRVIGPSRNPENSDLASANSNWVVRINESVYQRAAGV
tara:strand:- start:45 stop:626 length:582 start_codon:yes stop_codon:yes gene_type:complete